MDSGKINNKKNEFSEVKLRNRRMAPHFGKRGVSDKNPDGGFSNGKRKMQRRRLKRVNQKLGDKLFHGFEPRGLRLSQTLHELPRSRKKIPSHKRHCLASSSLYERIGTLLGTRSFAHLPVLRRFLSYVAFDPSDLVH